MEKNEKIRNVKNFNELLDTEFGVIGNEKRDDFEKKAHYLLLAKL